MSISQGYQQLGRGRRLLRKRGSLVYWCQIIVDVLLTMILLAMLIHFKIGDITPNYRVLLVTAMLLQVVVYAAYGVYRQSGSLFNGCYRLGCAWALFLFLLLTIGFVTKVSEYFSREVFLLWAFLGFALQLFVYAMLYRSVVQLRDKFADSTRCLIVGNGRLGHHLKNAINGNKWIPDKVLGFVSCHDFQCYESDSITINEVPILGDLEDIRRTIIEYEIERVYIAVPLSLSNKVEGLHVQLLDLNVDLIWVPDIYALQLLNHSIKEVAGLPLIFLNESPITSTRTGIFFKEMMDRSVAALLLLLLSPYLIIMAIGCLLYTSPSPRDRG